MTRRRSARASTARHASWSWSSVSAVAYSGPASTTASIQVPLALKQFLHVAACGSLAAAPEGSEGQLPLLAGATDAEVIAQCIAGDRRCREGTPTSFSIGRAPASH